MPFTIAFFSGDVISMGDSWSSGSGVGVDAGVVLDFLTLLEEENWSDRLDAIGLSFWKSRLKTVVSVRSWHHLFTEHVKKSIRDVERDGK